MKSNIAALDGDVTQFDEVRAGGRGEAATGGRIIQAGNEAVVTGGQVGG